MNSERHDARVCTELPRAALIERVAKLLRTDGGLDSRIPPGRCVLCLENLSRSYHVCDSRGPAVRSWDVGPGTPEEAAALALKKEFPDDIWLAPVRLCYCAETSDIHDAAVLFNRERWRKILNTAKQETDFVAGKDRQY